MTLKKQGKSNDLAWRIQIAREHQFYEWSKNFLLGCVALVLMLACMGAGGQ